MKTYIVTRKVLNRKVIEMYEELTVGRTEVTDTAYFAEGPPEAPRMWVPNPIHATKMLFEEAAILAYQYRVDQRDEKAEDDDYMVEYGVSRLTYQVEDVPLVVEPE